MARGLKLKHSKIQESPGDKTQFFPFFLYAVENDFIWSLTMVLSLVGFSFVIASICFVFLLLSSPLVMMQFL